MKKEFTNIKVEIINVNEEVVLISGLFSNSVEGLQEDNTLMSED